MRFRFLLLACVLVASGASGAASAAEPEPWPRWERFDAASTETVDHAAWTEWLGRHVTEHPSGIHRVAYAAVTAADRQALRSYIAGLEGTAVSGLNRDEQRAFWINLYNAVTVDVVLAHYPVESIRDIAISPGWFTRGPWKKPLTQVEGVALSLDDIEHRILRPIWQDPRTHYAVNCASLGCPNLATRAYTAENLEALLERGARDYVNHPRGARVEGGELFVSSIYAWFESDFGGSEAGVIRHLRAYAEPGLAAALAGIGSIEDHDYDWSLNAP